MKNRRRAGKRFATLAILVQIAAISGLSTSIVAKPSPNKTVKGADNAEIKVNVSDADVTISYKAPTLSRTDNRIYLALGTHQEIGAAVLPFQQGEQGSTVFLPFKADRLLTVRPSDPGKVRQQTWSQWKWNASEESNDIKSVVHEDTVIFTLPRNWFGKAGTVDFACYAKDMSQNGGWGSLFGCSDPAVTGGSGDKYISTYFELNLTGKGDGLLTARRRFASTDKLRIYQLFVRLFGNTNETRKEDGTMADNGVGKFADINDAALSSLQQMGFTHVWLTGVLQQATAADYSSIGQPADDPDLLKGLAGSPYAIKDYFDVCPDYARDPAHRLAEFKALLDRLHKHKLKALIDFVPNHVARSYNSHVKPDQNFGTKGNDGKGDDTSAFFSPANNFFYLKPDGGGPPLHMPTCQDGRAVSPTCKIIAALKERGDQNENQGTSLQICDGLFDGEKDHGKVTGNNRASWSPDLGDWYETVKLNYGFDFTVADKHVREYPNAAAPDKPIPDTWKKMDSVIAYWQRQGVDGFRCDMSHMVPPEFWNWAIAHARARHADVAFIGEAYDNDPAKVPSADPVISKLNGGRSNVMFDLLNAGFNAVYDDPTYRAIKKIYEGPGWANDIDAAHADDFIFENSLRYGENHDEVRLAAKSQWGGIGMQVGRPVSATLYGLSRGPVMVYNGQEVGEPGAGTEGFGGDDARTSIFDYWSMPEMVKWVSDHKYDGAHLSDEQKELRKYYGRVMQVVGKPAFRDGIFVPLNAANRDNTKFGRIGNEQPSGHWLYAFLRYDKQSGQRFLVLVNLNPKTLMGDVKVQFPNAVLKAIGLDTLSRDTHLNLRDRIVETEASAGGATIGETADAGIPVGEIPPLTARYFEITVAKPSK